MPIPEPFPHHPGRTILQLHAATNCRINCRCRAARMGPIMKIDALQGADALLARLTGSTHVLEAPADGSAFSRASEAGAEGVAEAGVGVRHQANGADDSRGSERPWWWRVFGG